MRGKLKTLLEWVLDGQRKEAKQRKAIKITNDKTYDEVMKAIYGD